MSSPTTSAGRAWAEATGNTGAAGASTRSIRIDRGATAGTEPVASPLSAPAPRYTFAPLRESDLPLARRWLLEPHVRRWWNDDPDEHDYPEGTIAEWMKAVRGEDPTDMFVIHLDARPIGVIQSYRVQDYPEYVAELGELPAAAVSVDVFIGEPALIGKGHGAALMRAFLPLAFDRYQLDYCVIGPSKSNLAAIRSYEKAGFRYLKEYREEDTIDPPHTLLEIRRADLEIAPTA